MNGISAEMKDSEVPTPAEQPKPDKSPRKGAQKAHVGPSKAKSGNKAPRPKKGAKGAKSAKSPTRKVSGARQGSKAAKVLGLLKRSGGATLNEIRKATGWQAHSVRGFLSGALGKRMGLKVTSTKLEGKDRRYAVKN